MIDTVVFENEYGERLNPQQYGILMRYHDEPPPEPRIHQYELAGMDGVLDMTEWAGETKYNNREVTVAFRDMTARYYDMISQFCLGRTVKIMFSSDPLYYYYGRCISDNRSVRQRMLDGEMKFSCEPFRLARALTSVSVDISGDASSSIALKSRRKSVVPVITTSIIDTTCTYRGKTYSLTGENTFSDFIITDRPNTLTVDYTSGTLNTVTITWRDGVL